MSELPKLYRPIKIRFWSLRNGLGAGMGVIFDIDTEVTRTVMRVKTAVGWKWQIKNYHALLEHDYFVETDQELLDEYGCDLEFEVNIND